MGRPFKPGAEWTGNAKGKPKGTKNAFRKSSIILEAQRDLKRLKELYRAIINGDASQEILAEFGIKTITVANKLEASKCLRQMAKEEIALETARLQEAVLEKDARAAAKANANSAPSFNANPSGKSLAVVEVSTLRQVG